MKTITVKVSDEEFDRIKNICNEKNITQSELIRNQLYTEYVDFKSIARSLTTIQKLQSDYPNDTSKRILKEVNTIWHSLNL